MQEGDGTMHGLPDGLADGFGLRFERPLAIVGGGEVAAGLLAALEARGCALVAADGGARHFSEAGLVPEAIIGDLDSVEDVAGWATRTQVIRIEDQMSTDFGKCLMVTHAPVTIAVGMTGGRLDHMLATLETMAMHAAARAMVLVDAEDVALVCVGDVSFFAEKGARVSVHPLLPLTFASSDGLAYPLDGLLLGPGQRSGVSNNASGGPVTIRVAKGARTPWLLVMAKTALWPLVELVLERAQASSGSA